jgi:hypothetical protein
MITISRLNELLIYDPTTGKLIWKPRPGCARNDRAGKVAGCLRPDGYLGVSIDRRPLLAHRVIWAMYHGKWPMSYLDHINRVRNDNRIENLREVTYSQNCQNTKRSIRNTQGVKGVYSNSGGYEARIYINKKLIYLGFYKTKDEAIAARKAAHKIYHTHCGEE